MKSCVECVFCKDGLSFGKFMLHKLCRILSKCDTRSIPHHIIHKLTENQLSFLVESSLNIECWLMFVMFGS